LVKPRLELSRLERFASLFRRETAQLAQLLYHGLPAIRPEASELLEQPLYPLLLLGGQVLKQLHAVQNPLPLVRRQTAEAIEALP
jgi:hypothetical protein